MHVSQAAREPEPKRCRRHSAKGARAKDYSTKPQAQMGIALGGPDLSAGGLGSSSCRPG